MTWEVMVAAQRLLERTYSPAIPRDAGPSGMFIYADAQLCPGCRSPLGLPALSCAVCGLTLTGPEPRRVFEALRQVDVLVAGLYAAAGRTTVAEPTGAVDRPTEPAMSPAMSSASVPRILLGLGALCLLVAALVFLAVAWAALGIEGRTAVLGGFALVAGVLTAWVAGRDLRAGAEALSAVTLGLLALVLGGAWRAGWLGTLGDEPFLVVAGVAVAAAAAATGRWAATTPVATLVGAEVIATLGLVAAAIGVPGTIQRGDAVAALAALAIFAVGVAVGHRLGLRVLTLGAGAGTAVCWLLLVWVGVLRLEILTVAHLWGDLALWPLLVATALAAAIAVPRRLPTELRVLAASIAVVLGTLVVTVASFDESPTRLALVELAVVAAYAVLSTMLPGAWKWLCAAPPVIAALGLAASVLRLTAVAVVELVLNEPWTRGVVDRLDAPDVPWTWPLLLPAGVVGIGLTAATILHCDGRQPRAVVMPSAAALVVALGLLPALYGAPLVAAVTAVLVATAALAVAGVALGGVVLVASAAGTATLALLAGLASDWVTAGVLAVLTVAAVAAELRGARTLEDLKVAGTFIAPLTGAGLIWTVGHLAGVETVWRAVPVLLVLGAAILVRPVVEREVATSAAAVLAVAGSVLGVGTIDQTWLAIYLTMAGVIATVSSLAHPSRRHLAWAGLALLTLAQWIRLHQIGVGTVEAYTLPLALVLLVVGTVALLRGNGSSLATLTPGLALALVPTLLQVLVDPLGTRALLLGLGCLVLVAVGLASGWAAPLLAGAAVGALLVLRQGTLAQVIPQWMLIGLVGVALTVVGVTWEQRLQEFRKVSAYVRGLR